MTEISTVFTLKSECDASLASNYIWSSCLRVNPQLLYFYPFTIISLHFRFEFTMYRLTVCAKDSLSVSSMN